MKQALVSAVLIADEIIDRYRAIRGTNLLLHCRLVNGRHVCKRGVTIMTWKKIKFIVNTAVRGV